MPIRWQCTTCGKGRGMVREPCPVCSRPILVPCPKCGHPDVLPGSPCPSCHRPIPPAEEYKLRMYIRTLYRTAVATCVGVLVAVVLDWSWWLTGGIFIVGGSFLFATLMALVNVRLEASGEAEDG